MSEAARVQGAATDGNATQAAQLPLQLRQRARELVPVLRERAAECERLGQLPEATVAEFQRAGFFRICQPARWDGLELDPQVFFDVQMILAEGCMSSAWVLGVVAIHNWQLALFDDRAAADVWGEENWDVMGLQGTGSHDIVVEDVFVPAYRTHKAGDGFACDSPGNVVNTGPLFRIPFGQIFVRAVSSSSIGASGMFLSHPLNRIFRDLHSGRGHVANTPGKFARNWGAVQLGQENTDFSL